MSDEGRLISPRKNPHGRLVPPEKVEERQERERAARVDRFAVRASHLAGVSQPAPAWREVPAVPQEAWDAADNSLERLREQLRRR